MNLPGLESEGCESLDQLDRLKDFWEPMLLFTICSILAAILFELSIIEISGKVRFQSGAGRLREVVSGTVWHRRLNLSLPQGSISLRFNTDRVPFSRLSVKISRLLPLQIFSFSCTWIK